MKKTTLMKSVFTLIAVVLSLLPGRAQVTSMADLYGTYKFTADVTVSDAGKALTDHFKNDCEVVITKCSWGIYDGEIQGLAGATAAQSINGIDLTTNTIKITNPNGNGLWGGGLYMSNTEGVYPFGGGYSDILYTFDPSTKTFTLPDFTLVTCDHSVPSTTIMATFTNAKLTLVESENIVVTDLSGDWHFTAGKGTYDTMEGSTLPTEFDMTITASNDTKKAYDISLTLGDYAPLALTATFDGLTLTIPFNETYFDVENKIGIVNNYGEARPGTITFNLLNENLLSLTSGMTIAQDSISLEMRGRYMQWYMSGSAKKQGAEEVATTWDGTYTVKTGNIYKAKEDYEYPETFEMEVTYNADNDMYLITKFLGEDVSTLNNGGFLLIPSADEPNQAEIKTGAFLRTIERGAQYLCLKDMNLSDGTLILTRLEDGTYTISDFSVSYMTYNTDNTPKHELAAFYQTVTAEKAPAEEPFTWANTFAVKVGGVDVYKEIEGYTYPAEFEMEVSYNANYDMYLVTKFLGQDLVLLNNGGIRLTVSADDPNKAELTTTNAYLKTIVAGESFLALKDMNLSSSPIILTYNGDGTVTIDNFCVSYMTYDDSWTQQHAAAALYKDVTATIAEEEEKPLPTEFTWGDVFTVKTSNVTVYKEIEGYTYPTEFEMEVTYYEDYDMYLVTKFLGEDIATLNNGGIRLTVSADDPNKAELTTTNAYLKTIVGGESYLALKDMNLSSTPLTLTHNGDGTVTISDFCVSYLTYDESNSQIHAAAALYSGVTASGSFALVGVEEVETTPALNVWSANGTIYVGGEVQNITVYDMSGRTVFSGVASQVNGLNKGLYIVKAENTVAKVAVK